MSGILKNTKRFKLITFDLIGTLINPRMPRDMYLKIESMNNELSSVSSNFAEDFIKQSKLLRPAYPNYGLKAGLMWQQWFILVVNKVCREIYDIHDEDLIRTLATVVIDVHKQSCTWSVSDGSVALLSDLDKLPQGPSIGVITNFDPRTETILKNVHLHKYLDIVINSYEAGVEKPEKRIFDRALKTSEVFGIRPSEALHIGRHPFKDYIGARSAGWKALLISDEDPVSIVDQYPVVSPQHIFKTLSDLHNFMRDGRTLCF